MTVKLCKDCKFFKVGLIDKLLNGSGFAKCSRVDLNGGENYVTGKPLGPRYKYCSLERTFVTDSCGAEGKYFVEKS